MSSQRDRAPSHTDEFREDWPRVLWFASLFGAVLGVLLIGAALRTAPPPSAVPETDPAFLPAIEPAAPPAASSTPSPLPGQAVALDPVPVDRLADRVGSDLERMATGPDEWTAQVAVLCDAERVERMIERFGDLGGFHVLPSYLEEQPCFRVCWSRYRTREGARAASDLPPGLRAIAPNPVPKAVSEVIE